MYHFIGVVNMFDVYPDFVFPIYENSSDGGLYFHHCEEEGKIICFDAITQSVHDRITYIKDVEIEWLDGHDIEMYVRDEQDGINTVGVKKVDLNADFSFTEGKDPVYAFQEKKNKIICGFRKSMAKYLSSYETSESVLNKQIRRFVQSTLHPTRRIFSYSLPDSKITQKKIINELKESLAGVPSFDKDFNSVMTKGPSLNFHKIKIDGPVYKTESINVDELNHIMDVQKDWNEEFLLLSFVFDSILKRTSCISELYKVCIRCQSAIIENDVVELNKLLLKHRELLQSQEEAKVIKQFMIKCNSFKRSANAFWD